MYFPPSDPNQGNAAGPPQALPLPGQNPMAGPQASMQQQQGQPGGMPPIPNVSGFPNPISQQQNNYAPIPPDEIKKWAELNHTSKGSIKQVEWSQNAGKYVMTMKDGNIEQVSPDYVLKNQGHWAPHPEHAMEAARFIAANQVKQHMQQVVLPQMLARQAQMHGGQAPAIMPGNAPMGGQQ